ncbi:MAG: DUF1993 domain-containing protein [Rhizobacter sp.]
MSITMYSASVPVFVRLLGNLSKWIDKAEAHAQAKKFDPSVYLSSRLAPDMLHFTRQVQIACDGPKFCMARLAGIEAPKHEDNEASLADLKGRIAKTIAFIQSVSEAQIVGSEARDINVPRRDGVLVMKGEDYLKHYAMPNFYFHVTTAYALLRHNGVELGKADFLAGI